MGQSSEKTGSDWMSVQKSPERVIRVIVEGACGRQQSLSEVCSAAVRCRRDYMRVTLGIVQK